MSKREKSEFGKGLSYCLALFLCHSERAPSYSKEISIKLGYDKESAENEDAKMWFYSAADHIFELEIPETLPKSLQKRLKIFESKVMFWRMPMDSKENPAPKDKQWAIQEAKDLIRLIDKHYGVKTDKGCWE